MDPKDQEIASLKKTLACVLALTAPEFALAKSMSQADADAFIAKSSADRQAQVTEVTKRNEEAEKVVYVSKSTGDVYKAKDDPRLVEMAKRMDDQAVAIEKASIRKQATELLGGMPGADDAHDLIIRSLTKSGAKQEEVDAALAVLKGMKETSTIGKRAAGFGGTDVPQGGDLDEALDKLTKGLTAFAKSKNITNVWTDALAAYAMTEEGAALKRAYDESLNG